MASTILADNGVSSGSAGIKTSADSTGVLALQTTTSGGTATTAVTIDTSQNVGIGTSSPESKVQVLDASAPTIQLSDGSGRNIKLSSGTSVNSPSLGTYYASDFLFFTNSAERMRIDSSGNVGIGTSSPAAKLHAKATTAADVLYRLEPYSNAYGSKLLISSVGSGDGGLRYGASGSNDMNVFAYGNLIFNVGSGNISGAVANERMRIDSSGNLLVGMTSNTNTFSARVVLSYDSGTTQWGVGPWINQPTKFYISANAGSQGVYLNGVTATSWTGWSDERIKEDLQPIENAAEKVCTLRAVTGVFKEDETKTRKPFLIAQDVLAVLPEAVDASNPERYGLSYTDTIPLLVAAIKEQQALINNLTERLTALEGAQA